VSQPDGLPFNADRVITHLGQRLGELTVENVKLTDVITTLIAAQNDAAKAQDDAQRPTP
jgi:hypothetical protein